MSEDNRFDVKPLAHLARLALTEAELADYAAQLERILDYVEKLNEVEVEGIEPTAHANPVYDMLREDAARPGFGVEKALSNAPRKAQEQFVVPKVVE